MLAAILICASLITPVDAHPLPVTTPDRIVIHKTDHTLEFIRGGKVLHSYKVALGRGGLDPKQRQGDQRTPEGIYHVDAKNPQSQFYKAFHLSYPAPADVARAQAHGVSPGGDVEIHGLPKTYKGLGSTQHLYDWTDGCIALSDEQVDELWPLVNVGTIVEIRH
jgi:murein L,D-transpeptidase YafK